MSLLHFLTFFFITVSAAPFSDVDQSHPYYEGIDSLRQQQIFKGYENGRFYPDVSIARIEFTHALVKSQFSPTEIEECDIDTLPVQFTDVTYDSWYGQTLCMAQQEGIIGGYPDKTFAPEKAVNFAEAATILVRAYSVLQSINHVYEDNIWYRPYINDMSMLEAIPPSITGPDHYVRRGEIAEMMYRLQLIVQTGKLPRRTYIEASEFNRGGDWENYIMPGRPFKLWYPAEWEEPYRVARRHAWSTVPRIESITHLYLGPKNSCIGNARCVEKPYIVREYDPDDWERITTELLRFTTIISDEELNGVQMIVFEEQAEECTHRSVMLRNRRFIYSFFAECAGSSSSRARLLQLLVEKLEL